MSHSTPTQLRFPTIAGFSVRTDFNGGAISSDFGALLLHCVDRQTGLIDRMASAIHQVSMGSDTIFKNQIFLGLPTPFENA